MSWTRAEICSTLRISTASVRSGSAAAGLGNPAQQRLQEERFVGRAPLRARWPGATHSPPPDCRLLPARIPPAREEAFSRVQGERDAVGVGHIATLLQRGAIGALGLPRHSGLQITAAKPEAGGAPFPR